MAQPQLPVELAEKIIRLVKGKRFLMKLLSTSDAGPALRRIAANIMYRNINLKLDAHPITSPEDTDVETVRLDLVRFVAPSVRSLVITDGIGMWDEAFNEEMNIQAEVIFPLLVNLQRLKVDHFSPATRSLLSKPFPSDLLTHLAWTCSEVDEAAFIAFLVAQPQLVFLEISPDDLTLADLPCHSLMNLKTLRAVVNDVVAPKILPGRTISYLEADLHEVPMSPELKESLAHITTLSCCSTWTREAFEAIRHCRNLEYLRLCDASLGEIYDYIDVLKPMTISYVNIISPEASDRDDGRIADFFEKIGSLQLLDIASTEHEWLTHRYTRYKRGSIDQPTKLSIHDESQWEHWWSRRKIRPLLRKIHSGRIENA